MTHPVESVEEGPDGVTVGCACGATFTAGSEHAARDRHAGHARVQDARAELEAGVARKEEREGNGG